MSCFCCVSGWLVEIEVIIVLFVGFLILKVVCSLVSIFFGIRLFRFMVWLVWLMLVSMILFRIEIIVVLLFLVMVILSELLSWSVLLLFNCRCKFD